MIDELAGGSGFLLRRDALANGLNDQYLRRQVKAGRLIRLRQGVYAAAEAWVPASAVDRHRILSGAILALYGDDVALSHVSACLEHGGPDWGLDLANVHLTNLFGIGERTAARVVHHRGTCRVGDVTRSSGHWITAPTRTALDTASTCGRDAGVSVLDWYLNRGLTDPESLDASFAAKKEWPDTLSLHRVIQLSDARSESVGETRTRLMITDAHLPRPEAQFKIFHPSGFLAGRVDFAWPRQRLMLEFDGRQKYLAFRRPGESIADAILREKSREDLLRELTGWWMLRITWADLATPTLTVGRIKSAMARAAA